MRRAYDIRYTQDRELSWLKFNERVLAEARDESVPLMERLKFAGDHVVLPRVVDEFAAGRFGRRDGQLCYRKADCSWIPVRTVEYSAGKAEPVTV